MKQLKIYDPVYRITVFVVLEPDGDKAKKRFASLFNDDDVLKLDFGERVGAKSMWDEDVCKEYGIWLRNKKNTGHIVHECLHITQQVLEPRGIYLKSSPEAYTYYQEFLFNQITDWLCHS